MMVVALLFVGAGTRASDGLCTAPPHQLGCFQNPYRDPQGKSHLVLSKQVGTADAAMTHDRCVTLCCKAGYKPGSLAGLEHGGDCYCGRGLGPYTIPRSNACTTPCFGDHEEICGGKGAMDVMSISSCAGDNVPWKQAAAAPAPTLQPCGVKGCTRCPSEDACCIGKSPDSYKVPGGYGCSPPGNMTGGCASGGFGKNAGLPAGRCCCGLGPSAISTSQPNVLIVGDSVSDGYIPHVQAVMHNTTNVQHGPNNAGGGCADGVGYGAWCTKYFVRTPQFTLPPWDVITFNYGLHDGADTNASYLSGISSIADQLIDTAKSANPSKPSRLIYFQTTIPGGANSVPGEPVSPNDQRVIELNDIAKGVMDSRNITVVDLYATMTACGKLCSGCKPHCSNPAGYQYLVDHAIVPAIKKALLQQ